MTFGQGLRSAWFLLSISLRNILNLGQNIYFNIDTHRFPATYLLTLTFCIVSSPAKQNKNTRISLNTTSVHLARDSCRQLVVNNTMYQRKVDVDMLNAVKSVLADVSSVSPSSEMSANTLFTAFSISKSTLCCYILRFTVTPMKTKTSSHRYWYPMVVNKSS